ncbi:MAG TPA: hypothetical protein VJS92_08765 [Candidatus Polarisedimenticolaceae bacterium]|nr:hypothetical protein [Candidatus Polarisedimenticolaceae bacterium]
MNVKRALALLGVAAVVVLGELQFATVVRADPPLDCSAVLCARCPAGFVAKPTPGNCCHCVRAH